MARIISTNRADYEKNRRGMVDYANTYIYIYTKLPLYSTYRVSQSSHPLVLSTSSKAVAADGRHTNLPRNRSGKHERV
jgi:hypothetical protein